MNDLKPFYDALTTDQKKAFREDCYKKLPWSKSTFHNKINGETRITQLEEPIIKKLIKKYGP